MTCASKLVNEISLLVCGWRKLQNSNSLSNC